MIPEAYKANFDTLCDAVKDDNICLLECKDSETGKPVYTICAVNYTDGFSLVPVASLFDGNPYEQLIPPEGIEP